MSARKSCPGQPFRMIFMALPMRRPGISLRIMIFPAALSQAISQIKLQNHNLIPKSASSVKVSEAMPTEVRTLHSLDFPVSVQDIRINQNQHYIIFLLSAFHQRQVKAQESVLHQLINYFQQESSCSILDFAINLLRILISQFVFRHSYIFNN